MSEIIVLNTGPIIAIGKMGALDVIQTLPIELISPAEVHLEIEAGKSAGYSVDFPSWVQVASLSTPLSRLTIANLDAGEAAVIQLALERDISQVCIDELKGRRAAVASGLSVVGSLGLLGRAKKIGIIDRVEPFLRRAQQNGIYYHPKLIETFLSRLGE